MTSALPLDEAAKVVVQELAGEDAVQVVEVLSDNHEITDEQIVARTGIKLNNVRKLLYTLFEHNLVFYRRVRDRTAGWFKYYWSLNRTNLDILVKMKKRAVLQKLKSRLDYEKSSMFFHCPNHPEIRLTFEEAMEVNFRCPQCDAQLQHYDNSKIIMVLEHKVHQLQKELGES